MPSPFSKKNLAFICFVLFSIGLVIILVSSRSNFGLRLNLSKFGDESSGFPLGSNLGYVSLSESQIKNRIQGDNPYGSLTLTNASIILDEVIQKAKKLSPEIYASIYDHSGVLTTLYNQVQTTLPGTMEFRNNITSGTNVNDILRESYKLSYPMEKLMGNIAMMATKS